MLFLCRIAARDKPAMPAPTIRMGGCFDSDIVGGALGGCWAFEADSLGGWWTSHCEQDKQLPRLVLLRRRFFSVVLGVRRRRWSMEPPNSLIEVPWSVFRAVVLTCTVVGC